MASFFGPEKPKPFSAISEHYRKQLQLAKEIVRDESVVSLFTLGDVYNKNMCDLIRNYGDIDIDNRVCYVGPEKGSIAENISQQMGLIYPVQHVVAGKTLYEDTACSDRMIPVEVISVGAERYFKTAGNECALSLKPPAGDEPSNDDAKTTEEKIDESCDANQTDRGGNSCNAQLSFLYKQPMQIYDRVIIKDTLEYIQNRRSFFRNVMSCLDKENGRMLIFHRPSKLISLPYYTEAKRKIAEQDIDFMALIQELVGLKYDVEWDIIVVPAVISRLKWLALLYYQFPCQLEVAAPSDIYGGLRELTEGSLKYSGDDIEFFDRQIIIIVSHPEIVPGPVSRRGGSDLAFIPTPQIYRMDVTDSSMVKYYNSAVRRQPTYTGPKEWWGTVIKDQWNEIDSSRIPPSRLNLYLRDNPSNDNMFGHRNMKTKPG